ncbi:MAG: cytochrome c5 family protein [Congregibacter sp.]
MFKQVFKILLPLAAIASMSSLLSMNAQAIDLTDEQRAEIAARIAPVGVVCLQGENCGGLPKASAMPTAATGAAVADGAMAVAASTPSADGEATYNVACMACHMTGAGGAPKVGDVDAWAPRIAKGIDALHNSGVNGVAGTAMMAKGGRADLSDEVIVAAVDYMVSQSQ